VPSFSDCAHGLTGNDSQGGWNPQPVQTTIEFRGKQVIRIPTASASVSE
jgi:hypothetical protein